MTDTATGTRCTAVVGLQWGDEGKGKVVDHLAPGRDAIVRYNGGANAGHTVVVEGQRFALHLVPCGVLSGATHAVIANGVVVDPDVLTEELGGLTSRGVGVEGVVVSTRAHVVMPYHKAEDALRERVLSGAESGERQIGTTLRGIGPCYADKAHRATAVRVGDLVRPDVLRERIGLACRLKNAMFPGLDPGFEPLDPEGLVDWALAAGRRMAPHMRDTTALLQDVIATGGSVLFEGANATMLDLDHGTFPYVTSSSCTVPGIGPGTGLAPGTLAAAGLGVIGVMKAYSTRVGAGPFPTELRNEIGDRIRDRGREYGTTTGRPRRTGWLDLAAVRYAARLNGVSGLAVTLLDVLAGFDELKVCTGHRLRDGSAAKGMDPDGSAMGELEPVYETLPGFAEEIGTARSFRELPVAARTYLERIERFVGVPIVLVGVGPDRAQIIIR